MIGTNMFVPTVPETSIGTNSTYINKYWDKQYILYKQALEQTGPV